MCPQPRHPAVSRPCVPALLLPRPEGKTSPVPAGSVQAPSPAVPRPSRRMVGMQRWRPCPGCPWALLRRRLACRHSSPRRGRWPPVPGSGRTRALVRHRDGSACLAARAGDSTPSPVSPQPGTGTGTGTRSRQSRLLPRSLSVFSPWGRGKSFSTQSRRQCQQCPKPIRFSLGGTEPSTVRAAMPTRRSARAAPLPAALPRRHAADAGPQPPGQLPAARSTQRASLPHLLRFGVFPHCSQWSTQNQGDVLFMRNEY